MQKVITINLNGNAFQLDEQGVPWIRNHAIHWAGSVEFDPFDPNSVWVTSGNGLFKNSDIDRGDTWTFNVAGLEETVPLNAVSVVRQPPSAPPAAWTCFAYLACVSMYLGFFAWYRGLAIGPMAQVSQVQLVQPVLVEYLTGLIREEDFLAAAAKELAVTGTRASAPASAARC